MNRERISVLAPLGPAIERMRTVLFRPFDLGKWLVIGFSAWLAGFNGGGGRVNLNIPAGGWGGGGGGGGDGGEGLGEALQELWAQIALAGCLVFLVLGCLLAVALAIVLLWVSARAEFIFLDNVLANRAEIVAPWKRFRRAGNSLFGFQLVLIAAGVAAAAVLVGGFLLALGGLAGFDRLEEIRGGPAIAALVVFVLLLVLLLAVLLYVSYFLQAFIVPLMHRYELDVVAAWRRFLALFRAHPGPLLLSGLLWLALGLGVGVALVAVGCLTCCLGFLLLMIPYVGSVLLLPVSVTYRAYTVELLARMEPGLLARVGS